MKRAHTRIGPSWALVPLGALLIALWLRPSSDDEVDALLRHASRALRGNDVAEARRSVDAARERLHGGAEPSTALVTKLEKLEMSVLLDEHRPHAAYKAAVRVRQRGCAALPGVPCVRDRDAFTVGDTRSIEADLFDVYPHMTHYLRQRGLTADADRSLREYIDLWHSFRGINPCLYVDNLGNVLWTLYQHLEDNPALARPNVDWGPWLAEVRAAGDRCVSARGGERPHEACDDECWQEFTINRGALETLVAARSRTPVSEELADLLVALLAGNERHAAWSAYLRGMSHLAAGHHQEAAELLGLAWDAHGVEHRADSEWPGWLALHYRAQALERAGLESEADAVYAAAARERWAILAANPFVGHEVIPTSVLWLDAHHVALQLRKGDVAGAVCTARLNLSNLAGALARKTVHEDANEAFARLDRELYRLRVEPPSVTAEAAHHAQLRKIEEEIEALQREVARPAPPPLDRCDAVASPKAGERHLVFYPHPEGDAVVIGVGPPGLTGEPLLAHARISRGALERWKAGAADPEILRPLAGILDGATAVCIYAAGPIAELPLHTLPLDEIPLSQRLPTAYCHDYGPPGRDPRSSPGTATYIAPRPQVGLDTEGEFATLRAYYHSAVEWAPVPRLFDRERPLTDVFVMSMFQDESAYRIDDAMLHPLSPAFARIPPQIVLLACATGRAGADAPAGALVLSQSLLLGGAWVVLGAVDELTEDEARAALECLFDPSAGVRPIDFALEQRAHTCARADPFLYRFRLHKRIPIQTQPEITP